MAEPIFYFSLYQKKFIQLLNILLNETLILEKEERKGLFNDILNTFYL